MLLLLAAGVELALELELELELELSEEELLLDDESFDDESLDESFEAEPESSFLLALSEAEPPPLFA